MRLDGKRFVFGTRVLDDDSILTVRKNEAVPVVGGKPEIAESFEVLSNMKMHSRHSNF